MKHLKKQLVQAFIVLGLVAGLAAPASAGGQAGALGVGAEFELSPGVIFQGPGAGGVAGPLGGVSVNKDLGLFHVGGMFGYADPGGPNNSIFELGGRFFYHVHMTPMSDFGAGGMIGIRYQDLAGPNRTDLLVEPAVQIRAFIANNVCLSFTAGISIIFPSGPGTGDPGFAITGQPNAGAGVHYYFF